MLKARWSLSTINRSSALPHAKHPDTRTVEDILSDIVSIPTVTGKLEANDACLDYIETFLKHYGMHTKRFVRNGVGSLVATTRRTKTPTVFFLAHQDVVEAPAELFTLRKQDGKYTGRGVLDMKVSIASVLGTVQQLAGKLHEYDFGIMIVSDEEIGGFDGASLLADKGYHAKVMVLSDGGDCDWGMEEAAKGLWWVTFEAEGKVVHGSRPWQGVNPIETLLAAAADVKALFPNVGPEASSVSMNVFNAGKTINQIPATASVSFDMRPLSLDEERRLHQAVAEIAEKHGVSMTTEAETSVMQHNLNSTYLSAYKACVESVIGRPVKGVLSQASSDARYFAPYGTEFAVGYPEGGGHHGLDEWISEDSPEKLKQVYLRYLEQVAKLP